MNGLIFKKKDCIFLILNLFDKKMFFSHILIYFVFLLLFTLVEGGMPRVFVSDTCFEGPEWYQILKIHLVVASNAIKCMLMDVIFDETRVRTCRHRIYKRNLVSVKKKLNLKQ